jgi:hypothetical protein
MRRFFTCLMEHAASKADNNDGDADIYTDDGSEIDDADGATEPLSPNSSSLSTLRERRLSSSTATNGAAEHRILLKKSQRKVNEQSIQPCDLFFML